MIDDVLIEATTMMDGAIEHTRERLSRIRTGRANPQLLANLRVEYYGTPTPMQQVASVTAPSQLSGQPGPLVRRSGRSSSNAMLRLTGGSFLPLPALQERSLNTVAIR